MNQNNVCVNPMGPHYYVDDYREFPEGLRDAVHDRMAKMMTDINEDHGWEIGILHVKANTPITTVTYGDSYEDGFEIEPFDVSMDWYSREQLWSVEW